MFLSSIVIFIIMVIIIINIEMIIGVIRKNRRRIVVESILWFGN